MTKRAIFIGLAGVVLLSLFAYFNDFLLNQEYMIGTYLPMVIYGGLLISILAIGPLLRFLGLKNGLSGKEYASIVAIMLFACYIPGGGLMGHFFTIQIMPKYHEMCNPAFQQKQITKLAPKRMLIDLEDNGQAALTSYLNGHTTSKGRDAQPYSLESVDSHHDLLVAGRSVFQLCHAWAGNRRSQTVVST
jgi:hypothetical protein